MSKRAEPHRKRRSRFLGMREQHDSTSGRLDRPLIRPVRQDRKRTRVELRRLA